MYEGPWPYLAPFPRYGQLLVQNRKIFLPPLIYGPRFGVGDPYGIFGKALQILKLESLGQSMVKI